MVLDLSTILERFSGQDRTICTLLTPSLSVVHQDPARRPTTISTQPLELETSWSRDDKGGVGYFRVLGIVRGPIPSLNYEPSVFGERPPPILHLRHGVAPLPTPGLTIGTETVTKFDQLEPVYGSGGSVSKEEIFYPYCCHW